MDLLKQVCTLEQAKRLKELGIEQKAIFWYCNANDLEPIAISNHPVNKGAIYNCKLKYSENLLEPKTSTEVIFGDLGKGRIKETYSAYTAAELGVMLPDEMYSKRGKSSWTCENVLLNRWGNYRANSDTEASTRADLLIYLLENNHTTPEEVNTRLNNQ